MSTVRITAAAIEELAAGGAAWDAEVRGFGVRRQVRDAVFVVKYRDTGGRQRFLTIGRYGAPWIEGDKSGKLGPDAARREAKRLLGLIAAGKDPAAERNAGRAAPTLAVLAERYLVEYAEPHKKPRTRVEDARLLKLHILPALGDRKARDIGKPDVARFHAAMRAIPVAANRALALLSAILGWAEKVGERPDGTNPCRHVDRFPEKARERVLSPADLARLGEALDRAAMGWREEAKAEWRRTCATQAEAEGIDPAEHRQWITAREPRRDSSEDWRAIAAFRLLIFTGARLSEILTLRWDWIDTAVGVARLPDSKTGAKNLYLPPGALAVLDVLPRMAGNPHVLPGDRPGAPFVGIQKPWQRVRDLAGLPDLRIHDLRHAFASAAVAAGDSLFIVGKLLGHRQASTTERYAHLAPDPAKAVADRTAERLRTMLAGESGGAVLPLRRGGSG